MSVLVDTSVWIDYFRNGKNSAELEYLIDENIIITNDLILAELVPTLKLRKHTNLIALLSSIEKITLTIDWNEIVDLQFECLKHGINKIGIPDLIIGQNAIGADIPLYSNDRHFSLISQFVPLKLFSRSIAT